MNLRRVAKDELGWSQVVALCSNSWSEQGLSYQDSIGWKLIAVDDSFYYLGREK